MQIGHVTIGTLCNVLENPNNKPHWALVRGAVFFLGMACWGMLIFLAKLYWGHVCICCDMPISESITVSVCTRIDE